MATNEELNTKLYEKMFSEQENFRSWLLKQPSEEILNHTYEYTVREDILMALEYLELESPQAKALLSSPTPLSDVYSEFEKRETNYMDVVRDCVESRADEIVQRHKAAVYPFPVSYAREHGEMDQYRASHQANIDCRDAIQDAITEHYHNNVLDVAGVNEVVDTFGFERTMFVVANTIREKDWDARFSHDNRQWAQAVPIYPDESGDRNRRLDYVIDRSHPGLVDIFARNLHHSFLLTQPLTKLDVANEAARICEKMKSLREPNSPNGTHFSVQLSTDFMTRASSKDTAALQKWLPYQSLALTGVNGEKGVFAMVDKAEDRTQPLRSPKERKPSVRQKLRQPLPEKTAEKVQKSKTQER